jgi:hypothetical protein
MEPKDMRSVALWMAVGAALVGLAILGESTPQRFHFGIYLAMASVLVTASCVLAPNGRVQNRVLVLASTLITLAALELGTAIYRELARYLDSSNGGAARFIREHPDLGYEPKDASVQVHARRVRDGHLVYDVVYSIDEQRHRLAKGEKTASCTVLFFGDSFVFGEGLNDDGTLPQQFLAEVGSRSNAVNLAFPGYGPNQTLRALESMRSDVAGNGRVAAVFTSLLPDHARRARGLYDWARFGPRYELTSEGQAVAAGRFDRFSGRPASWAAFRRELIGVLRGSALFDRLYQYPEITNPEEIKFADALLVAILARAAAIVKERFDAPLTVIGWDDESGHLKPILATLRDHGVDAIDKDALLKGPWTPDYLIPGDGHPSAKANGEIAASLARRLTGCP